MPTPVVLFAYNRPYHTERTLQALEKNDLSAQSILYVFSDGPRHHGVVEQVNAVRKVLKKKWNFRAIQIVERKNNWGLANNVIDGVGQVIARHGRAIILEDDVLFSPHTLRYFNQALDMYEHQPQVMHIGGFMYDLKADQKHPLPQCFFTRYVASQAWATWSRAWQYFEPDMELIALQFDSERKARFTFEHTMNFWRQIRQQRKGNIDSWAIRWYASVFLKGGLALEPGQSLIENIGHDGSGVHSAISNMFDTPVRTDPITEFPAVIQEDPNGYLLLKRFFKHRKGTLWQRLIRFLNNKVFRKIS